MSYFVLLGTLLFALGYGTHLWLAVEWTELRSAALAVLAFRVSVEVLVSTYFFAYIFAAASYYFSHHESPQIRPLPPQDQLPSVGVIYLCCGDLDCEALESLVRLRYAGRKHLVVHDDSSSSADQTEVDAAVDRLQRSLHAADWQITLLRRPTKEGAKSGAVNYVLRETGGLYDYFLLCDNDSTALYISALERSVAMFQEDSGLAVVQCRTMGIDSPGYCPMNRRLSRGIDAFDVFLSTQARFGWRPFVGHNALLRTSAVREVGGWTPDFFSDDLDLTVRLNLGGWRVIYARDIVFGEKHPPSYASLRKRNYKWAYGCMQVLQKHALPVLLTPRLNLAEKLSFFQFAGFYVMQSLLLAYLAVTFLVAPFLMPVHHFGIVGAILLGTLLIMVVFLPTMIYFLRERRAADGVATSVASAIVYGTMDFCSLRASLDCLARRRRKWVPTNARNKRSSSLHLWLEAAFGTSLLVVPLIYFPPLLYLPSAYLFAGRFLFGVAANSLYDDESWAGTADSPTAQIRIPGVATAAAAALLLSIILCLPLVAQTARGDAVSAASTSQMMIHGKQLYRDGEPFVIKGIYHGPWRPGTGPGRHYPFPAPELIEEDLRLIKELGANTIAIYDPPDYVLDLAHEQGLSVLYTFSLNFYAFGTEGFADERQRVLQRVADLKDKPALLGWILGNEIPVHAVVENGERVFEEGLAELYREVKALDPENFVTHSNWPPTKDLDLSFLDVISFNVYPLWPPEVVAAGYANYIREVLQPIAGEKPLLITEFGVNRIEAGDEGQVSLIRECWQDIMSAGACGGVVFEFADQWWKLYDNPVRPGNWWYRVPAEDDELRHDLDPEEHYGIMTGQREPFQAYAAVQDLFSVPHKSVARLASPYPRLLPAIASGVIVCAGAGLWLWALHARRRARAICRQGAGPGGGCPGSTEDRVTVSRR